MAIILDGINDITVSLVAGDAGTTQTEAEAGANNTKLITGNILTQNLIKLDNDGPITT